MSAPEQPIVDRGRLLCPNCRDVLVGLLDVTVHPTLRVRDGRLRLGRLADSLRSIREDAAEYSLADVLGDRLANEEVYCRRVCGYTISGHELRAMFEPEREGR